MSKTYLLLAKNGVVSRGKKLVVLTKPKQAKNFKGKFFVAQYNIDTINKIADTYGLGVEIVQKIDKTGVTIASSVL